MYDDQPPLNRTAFNDRRLTLATFMAKQRGLSWAGLPSEERDIYLDVAGDALRQFDARIQVLREDMQAFRSTEGFNPGDRVTIKRAGVDRYEFAEVLAVVSDVELAVRVEVEGTELDVDIATVHDHEPAPRHAP